MGSHISMEHPQGPTGTQVSPGSFEPSGNDSAPQKRAYDYGEELKGVGSSGDETSRGSTPSAKRLRRTSNSDAGNSKGGNSEDLDDGEIVESPLPSRVTPPVSTAPSYQVPDAPNAPISISSEDSETDVSPEANQELDETREADDENDPVNPQKDESTPSATVDHPQASLPGWNHGIQLGTRTGFGAKPANSFFAKPNQQTEKEKKRVRSRDRVSSFEASNATWNFPLDAPEINAPANISEEDGYWNALLNDLVVRLVRANDDRADRLTYKVVRAGWSVYFTRKMDFLKGTKKHAIATRLVAQDFMASLDKNTIDALLLDARQRQPVNPPPDDDVGLTDSGPLGGEDELHLQKKYFPSADDPSRYCLSCAGTGHTTQACPEPSCRFCDGKTHTSFGCPTRRRCKKCRQIGHTIDACQEKLALAPDELGGCAFCSADHEDEDCPEIWRSCFKPSESNTKKVKAIPAFCYTCGAEGHYGPECSLPEKGGRSANNGSWSKANRDLYVDPESEDIAIAWVGIDTSQITKGEFHIPGRATRKTHTHFVSSDESEDDDLIHAPIKRPQARGGIRIASNIGNTNGSSRGRGGGHQSWQPPLPPGPPPPLTGNGPRQSFQSGSSTTLPQRPQSYGHGRGSGRGRGPYRGRGRGRGRGKQ